MQMNVSEAGDYGVKAQRDPCASLGARHTDLKEAVAGWHCHSLIYVVLAAKNL